MNNNQWSSAQKFIKLFRSNKEWLRILGVQWPLKNNVGQFRNGKWQIENSVWHITNSLRHQQQTVSLSHLRCQRAAIYSCFGGRRDVWNAAPLKAGQQPLSGPSDFHPAVCVPAHYARQSAWISSLWANSPAKMLSHLRVEQRSITACQFTQSCHHILHKIS